MQLWVPGQVVRLHLSRLNKYKYLVYLGDSDDSEPLFFYISSEVYKIAKGNPEMMHQQLRVFKSQHQFLDHNSWLDCAKVCQEFSWQKIDILFGKKMAKAVGMIHEDLRAKIKKSIGESETLSNYEQRIIFQNLTK